jgi:lysyl-tRNA synthetase class I
MDYWLESIIEAFEEAGIKATEEQKKSVAEFIKTCIEMERETNYYPPSPLISENDRLKKELEKERNKGICYVCRGKGSIVIQGPYHSSSSSCSNCRGEGRC